MDKMTKTRTLINNYLTTLELEDKDIDELTIMKEHMFNDAILICNLFHIDEVLSKYPNYKSFVDAAVIERLVFIFIVSTARDIIARAQDEEAVSLNGIKNALNITAIFKKFDI